MIFPANAPGRKEGEREIHEGLRGYFEASLGTLLLYRFERVQFDVHLPVCCSAHINIT